MAKQDIDFTRRDYWDQDSLLLYKEAVSRYPYCAPARLSFLLNLKVLNDPDYEEELAFTALSVPDRQRLQEEVQAVEEAATIWRERGERRMRQVARWTSAPVIQQTTLPVGRLMNVNAPVTTDINKDANEQENRFARAIRADEAAKAYDTAAPADDAWGEDWPARSRSARRNALRWARLEERRREALEAEAAAMAEAARRAKADANIAAAKAKAEAEALAADRLAASSSSTISMLLADEVKPAAKRSQTRRSKGFNPWAEIFTTEEFTISDWLKEDETSAQTEDSAVKSSGKSTKKATTKGKAKTTKTAKSKTAKAAKTTKATSKSTAAKSAPSAAKTTKAATKSVSAIKPATPDAVSPDDIIDRFLRETENEADIRIEPDVNRDYESFNPDKNSLREDWSMGSETLAQLYLAQGAPDKAIAIYRSLSLKFPEKNRYFAGLIQEAEDAKSKANASK